MGKHARKRQKVAPVVAPNEFEGINPLTDDAAKDDEERKLESLLFGTKFTPRVHDVLPVSDDEAQDSYRGKEMGHLLDEDVRLCRYFCKIPSLI